MGVVVSTLPTTFFGYTKIFQIYHNLLHFYIKIFAITITLFNPRHSNIFADYGQFADKSVIFPTRRFQGVSHPLPPDNYTNASGKIFLLDRIKLNV